MKIMPGVREDEVRGHARFQVFEVFLDLYAFEREKTVSKIEDFDRPLGSPFEEKGGAAPRFALAIGPGAKDDPINVDVPARSEQLQDSAATADLNVVGMGAQAKNLQRPAYVLEGESKHVLTQCPFIHTCQGAFPLAYRSSRCCLSLKVSMQAQKPSY